MVWWGHWARMSLNLSRYLQKGSLSFCLNRLILDWILVVVCMGKNVFRKTATNSAHVVIEFVVRLYSHFLALSLIEKGMNLNLPPSSLSCWILTLRNPPQSRWWIYRHLQIPSRRIWEALLRIVASARSYSRWFPAIWCMMDVMIEAGNIGPWGP